MPDQQMTNQQRKERLLKKFNDLMEKECVKDNPVLNTYLGSLMKDVEEGWEEAFTLGQEFGYLFAFKEAID